MEINKEEFLKQEGLIECPECQNIFKKECSICPVCRVDNDYDEEKERARKLIKWTKENILRCGAVSRFIKKTEEIFGVEE